MTRQLGIRTLSRWPALIGSDPFVCVADSKVLLVFTSIITIAEGSDIQFRLLCSITALVSQKLQAS